MENENNNNIGFWILLVTVILGFFIYSGLKSDKTPLIQYEATSMGVPIYPCDIFPDYVEGVLGDDWCQTYIDYGYANGIVMTQRILGEQSSLYNMSWTTEKPETCDKIAQNLYDQYKDKTDYRFPTKNRIYPK